MKLNIEELSRESGFHHETSDGWPIIMHDRLEDLIRLVVERCAQLADDADTRWDGHAIATEIRTLMED